VDNEGRPKWRIVKHDLEEFADCVRRHGLITKDQRRFHEAANQLTIEDIVNETARTIKDMEKRGLKVTISGQGVA
jgi:DNA-binding IscR family transcriptional regulator